MDSKSVGVDDGGLAKDMALRDFFAAKAMQAGLQMSMSGQVQAHSFQNAAAKRGVTETTLVAMLAYEAADAMLAARKAGGK